MTLPHFSGLATTDIISTGDRWERAMVASERDARLYLSPVRIPSPRPTPAPRRAGRAPRRQAKRTTATSTTSDDGPPPLEEVVRRIVREEIRALVASVLSPRAEGYSTRRGQGIPGYSDLESKRIVRLVGVQRGRWHWATREQVEAHERAQVAPAVVAREDAPGWSPDEALASAGLRLVGSR